MKIERYAEHMIPAIAAAHTRVAPRVLVEMAAVECLKKLEAEGGLQSGGIIVHVATGPDDGSSLPDRSAYAPVDERLKRILAGIDDEIEFFRDHMRILEELRAKMSARIAELQT